MKKEKKKINKSNDIKDTKINQCMPRELLSDWQRLSLLTK